MVGENVLALMVIMENNYIVSCICYSFYGNKYKALFSAPYDYYILDFSKW